MRCPEATDTWKEALDKLEKHLVAVDTAPPPLRSFLLQSLSRWHQQARPPLNVAWAPSTRAAIEAQLGLGPWNTLLGRISSQVSSCQDRHFRQQSSRRTGRRWTVALIKKLQEVAWDMWEHHNGILKKDPKRHKDRDPLAKADAAI